MPGADAVATTGAAIAAGFDAVGSWVGQAQWTRTVTGDSNARLRSSGIYVLDVEVIWIKPESMSLPAQLPLSVEIRSKHLRDACPDCVERARIVAAATRAGLSQYVARKRAVD